MITNKIFAFNPLGVNTYLLYDETKEALLIDCGTIYPAEEQQLADFISKNDLTLKRLLCTHLHFDHILGNSFIYKKYGIKPEAHQTEVEKQPALDMQIRAMGMPIDVEPVAFGGYLKDNECIHFGNSTLQALLVPGHSPASLAFYSAKDGFVVAGDVLFNGSIGRSDLWGGNHETLITSIQQRILTLPDETVVYPGHGPATTIIYEKTNNPFL